MVMVRDLKEQRKQFNEGMDAHIKEIQEACEHPDFFLKSSKESNNGYKEPLEALHEWRVFDCEICEKHWTMDIAPR